MRNLKRALSLALASVMLLGMMVVGTSASYSDVDADDNVEAIEVAQALKLMEGKGDDKFDPDGTVTRQELAGIITKLLKLNPDSYAGVSHFTDVDPNEWYAPYIEAVYSNGIMEGVGGGKFDRTTAVPAWQIGTAICKALGYFQTPGDYGDDPVMAGTRQARKAGLLDGLEGNNHLAPLTRSEIALVCLNALQATMVDVDENNGITVEGNGVTVTVGGATYIERTTTNSKYASFRPGEGVDEKETMELGEDVYGITLTKDDGDADDFGRTANTWEYQGEKIGTYAKTPDYSYVIKKSGQDIATYIKKEMKKDGWNVSDTTTYVNGTVGATNGGHTLKIGSTLELYMDPADDTGKKVATAVVLEPRVYTLTGDAETKVDGDKTQVKVPGVAGMNGFSDTYTIDNVTGYAGLKKDDVVLVVSGDKDTTDDPTVIITKATSVTGKASSLKNGEDLVVDGKAYKASELSGQTYDTDYKFADNHNDEFEFYLDASGAIVKAKLVEEGGEKNYAYVLETAFKEKSGDTLDSKDAAQARLLFTDGTTAVVSVSKVNNADPADGTMNASTGSVKTKFVTYREKSDGTYELTTTDVNTTPATSGDSIVKGQAKFLETDRDHVAANLVGNNNTIFLVNTGTADKPTITVYTGISNIPNIKNITTASDNVKGNVDEGVCKYVYILAPKSGVEGEAGQYVYIPANKSGSYDYHAIPSTEDTAAYRKVTAIVNGKTETIKLLANGQGAYKSSSDYTTAVAAETMYKVKTVNDEGIMTELDTAANSVAELTAKAGIQYSGGIIQTGYVKATGAWGDSYQTKDSTEVYYIDADGNVTELAPSSISKDTNDDVYILKTSDSGKVADLVYIVENTSSNVKIKKVTYKVTDSAQEYTTEITPDSSATIHEINTGVTESAAITEIKLELDDSEARYSLSAESVTAAADKNSIATTETCKIIATVIAEDGTEKTAVLGFGPES